MDFQQAKIEFIQSWGILGASWGINKTMAQIHALLLISPEALSTDEIMDELKISRGNANMNIRALIDWGIVEKDLRIGERKEFFVSKKDVLELARIIANERRKREIEPLLRTLNNVQQVEGDSSEELIEFKSVTSELLDFSNRVDGLFEKFSKSDKNWFYKILFKL